MIKRKTIAQGTAIILSLVMAFTIFPMSASAITGDGEDANTASETMDFVPGQLIVVTEQNTSKKQMTSIAGKAEGQVDTMSTMSDGAKVALVDVEEGSELDAAAALECEDEVLFVQPNYIYTLEEDEFPNDSAYLDGVQNYLKPPLEDGSNAGTMDAKGAWDQLIERGTTEKTLVAVIDSGVRLTHEDLAGQIVEDKCVTYNLGVKKGFKAGDNADDDYGHGTRVSGVICAGLNNGTGISSVAGNWVDLFAIDVAMPGDFSIYSIDMAKGIEYATDEGARLVNLSLGAYGRDYICERALKYAWDNGTLCICSAGNGNTPYYHFPGDSPYAVTVMANDVAGNPYYSSANLGTNYGVDKDISAPGVSIVMPNYGSDTSYSTTSGTSYASPATAGAIALLLAKEPDLTLREIKNLLYTSTGKESFSAEQDGQGFGKINVNTAMQNLLAEKTDPTKIVINKPGVKMYEGTDTYIEYAVYPGNADLSDVMITSSNEEIVEVDDDGILYAKAPGSATVQVTCGDVSSQCDVTVEGLPYITIDKKPYSTEGTFKMDELVDYIDDVEGDVITDGRGVYYYQYRIDLEENEKISAVMTINRDYAYLRIKDGDGNIVAYDSETQSKDYAALEYTAEHEGTYQIQVMWRKPAGNKLEANYTLKLASDRSFCEPAVDSIDNGQMHMSWPAVEFANSYRVRKYADKDLTELELEKNVTEPEFTDTAFDKDKANYYTVTSSLTTKAGVFFNGETPLVIKMDNPMTVKGRTYKVSYKKLKKRNVYLKRGRMMTVKNAEGTLTYTKTYGSKKITVNKTTGKIKLKKGLKKKKYKVRVKINAAGNDEYNPLTKTVTFWIRVK